ncbi:MAG: hypothetical protein MI748_05295 [Opitutales bacterium]|nr:hypothetical protein [Opitutales bacterium]
MGKNKGSSTFVIGIISLLLFYLAAKTRHPVLIITSIAGIAYTYFRFRTNYLIHRAQRRQLSRKEGSIEVETTEIKEKDSHDV